MNRLLLTTSLVLLPTAAMADPVTAFFISLGAGAATAAVLTNIAISIALNAAASLLAPKQKSQSATVADARVNVRLENAVRWQLGGTVPVGGSVGAFAEHDADGNFWYIVAHGDAELTGTPSYLLDDLPVTLSDGTDGFTAGDVLTNEFCLTSTGAQYEGTGTKVPVFRLYTVTPDATNAYGALPAAFTAAFTSLPTDFRLAGVCYTIVRCKVVKPEQRYTAYHWRGALGLGEPSVVMIGNFNRMYDPRNGAHNINDPTTWTASNGNAAIIAAWFRTAKYGRNRPMTEVSWTKVAEQANICDLTVLDRSSVSTPLYRAGAAFPDNKPRWECERDILEAADAINCYDENGLWYPKVGYYVAPTLQFTAARDILSAQTQITDDGETAVDGVVVYYLDPTLNYTRQPCAPWQNPDWFSASAVPNYHTEEILTCQNHNQAVRLAKAIGTRMAATRRASFATSIKGILAANERAIDLDYDATFTGPHEIVSPVEQDPNGVTCSFAVVPLASDKWTLGVGEEGEPPVATPALGLTATDLNTPAALSSASATGGAGQVTVNFVTANDSNQFAVSIWRGATNVFSASTLVHTVYALANVSSYATETGLAAGTWYYWAIPQNRAASQGPASGPFTTTVT